MKSEANGLPSNGAQSLHFIHSTTNHNQEATMRIFAYPWADGSVSICTAENKEEAAETFDQLGEVDHPEKIRSLKGPVLVTLKPVASDLSWALDSRGEEAIGEDLNSQLIEACYPSYSKEIDEALEHCPACQDGGPCEKHVKLLEAALREDQERQNEIKLN